MRWLAFAVALLSVAPLYAQGATTPLTERIEVNVVNVDVTVLDRHRNPVRGLTADDFEIREDGKLQKITNFFVVENDRVATTATSPTAANEERLKRRVLVVIDNTLVSKPRRNLLLEKLQSFIDEHFSGDYEWAIMSLGGGERTALPYTQDKQRIHDALLSIRHRGTIPRSDPSDTQVARYNRNKSDEEFDRETDFLNRYNGLQGLLKAQDITLSVGRIAQALAAAPGKKVVLLVTTGFPSGSMSSMAPEDAATLQKLHEYVVRETTSANVTLFILNPEGLTLDSEHAAADVAAHEDSGAFWLARQTGGQYLRGNSFSDSLQTFDQSTANFYSLGYALTRPEDQKYHRITVRLKRGNHYSLSYRPGYASQSTDEQLERALQSPLGIAAQRPSFPIELEVGASRSLQNKLVVPITASVAADKIQLIPEGEGPTGHLHMYLSIFDRGGRELGFHHFVRTVHSDKTDRIALTNSIALPRGSYHFVVTLRDDITNEIGIASADTTF
jgi:VWFA-related protein